MNDNPRGGTVFNVSKILSQQKDSPWEGATRSTGAIFSPLLKQRQRVSNQLFHITDWLPTFAKLAGVKVDKRVDGKNVWPALSCDLPSPREEVLHNLDDEVPYVSYTRGDWKYVAGTSNKGQYDGHISDANDRDEADLHFKQNYGQEILNSMVGQALLPFSKSKFGSTPITPSEVESIRGKAAVTCWNTNFLTNDESAECKPIDSHCLFNIVKDPCERINLANYYPAIVKQMENQVERFRRSALPSRNRPSDRRSDPGNFGGIWTWWYDELNITDSTSGARCPSHSSPLAQLLSVIVFAFIFLFLS